MASKISSKANQVRMYKHFAVITVLLTACIAIFADGERRDAIGSEVRSQQQRTALVNAEREKIGPTKLAQSTRPPTGGGFGSEEVSNPVVDEGAVALAGAGGMSARAGSEDFGRILPPAKVGAQGNFSGGVPIGLDKSRQPGGVSAYTEKKKAYVPTAEDRARLERAASGSGN